MTGAVRRRLPELAAVFVGLCWYAWAGGWRTLAPTSFDWLGGGDLTQHVMGWLFFRRSEWGLPLGRIDGFVWPSGTTVGFTDANPLLAIPAKLLSPILPRDFQYAGPWLGACFALQGFCGARLTALGSSHPLDRFLGGVLFVLAPPLLLRVGHDTLCGHFALVGLLALHLAPMPGPDAARRAVRAAGATTLLLAFVHPYLAAMAVVLTLALLARAVAAGALPRASALRAAGLLLAATVLAFAALGYFTSAPSHGTGFGLFSADLLAFVAPFGLSSFLPQPPLKLGQYEGNAYLGLGVLMLGAVAGLVAARRWRPDRAERRSLTPLLVACAVLAAFAASDQVRVGGTLVLDLRRLYGPLAGALGPFRSSGRFVWPLYYLVLAAAVLGTLRLVRRPAVATALLAAAVALQLADLARPARDRFFHERSWRPRDARWALAAGRYQHLALVPPQVVGLSGPCRGLVYEGEPWAPLAYEAYVLGMTVNSGYVARGAGERISPPCAELMREVEAGDVRPDTVYVAHGSALPQLVRAGARCGRLDGFDVCVAPGAADPFAEALGN